jgi:hypothetical protein
MKKYIKGNDGATLVAHPPARRAKVVNSKANIQKI